MDLLHCATKYWEKRGGRNYCQPARVCGGQKSGGGDGDHTHYNRQHPSHGINFGQQWGQDQLSPDQCRSGSSQCPHQWEIVFKSALTSFTRLHSETELLNPPDLFALSKENRKIEFPSFVKCSYVLSTSFHTFTK